MDFYDDSVRAAFVFEGAVKNLNALLVYVEVFQALEGRNVLLKVNVVPAIWTTRIDSLAFRVPFMAAMRTFDMALFNLHYWLPTNIIL